MNGYTYVSVSGQGLITLSPTNSTLNIVGAGAIVATTNPSNNTLTLNLSTSTITVSNFTVTNNLTLTPSSTGTIDNLIIGSVVPQPATFTTLNVTTSANLSPSNGTVTLSPTGTGTVVINPSAVGTIDNMTIGAVTPSTGNFTTVTLVGTQPTSSSSVVTKGYIAALSAAYGVALS